MDEASHSESGWWVCARMLTRMILTQAMNNVGLAANQCESHPKCNSNGSISKLNVQL